MKEMFFQKVVEKDLAAQGGRKHMRIVENDRQKTTDWLVMVGHERNFESLTEEIAVERIGEKEHVRIQLFDPALESSEALDSCARVKNVCLGKHGHHVCIDEKGFKREKS